MGTNGWLTLTLGSIAVPEYGLVDGPFGSNLPASLYTSEGVPVVRGSNLSLGKSRFKSHEFVFVSDETASSLSRSLCFPDDIIFTKKGTLGQTGIIPRNSKFSKFLLSSNQMKLTVSREVADPLFVYYYVSSPRCRERIVRESTASGVPKINVAYLRQFPIVLPPINEQRAIARILGALDDKIELNYQMNHTLEAMAQSIFKSWFVDFDPVVAKAAGRRPVIMSTDTEALLPSRFVESELGLIPEGWRVSTIGVEFNLTMGQSPPGNTYNELGEGLPFFQGKTDFGFRYPTRRIFCTVPTRLAEVGDTLVSVRAPVGSVNMASEKCAVGRGVAAIKHKSKSRSFTYYAMRALESEFAVFDGDGTLFGSIGKTDFEGIKIISPHRAVVDDFESAVYPMDERIVVNQQESGTLTALRDSLLPKFLSGEIRVGQIEKVIAEAV